MSRDELYYEVGGFLLLIIVFWLMIAAFFVFGTIIGLVINIFGGV